MKKQLFNIVTLLAFVFSCVSFTTVVGMEDKIEKIKQPEKQENTVYASWWSMGEQSTQAINDKFELNRVGFSKNDNNIMTFGCDRKSLSDLIDNFYILKKDNKLCHFITKSFSPDAELSKFCIFLKSKNNTRDGNITVLLVPKLYKDADLKTELSENEVNQFFEQKVLEKNITVLNDNPETIKMHEKNIDTLITEARESYEKNKLWEKKLEEDYKNQIKIEEEKKKQEEIKKKKKLDKEKSKQPQTGPENQKAEQKNLITEKIKQLEVKLNNLITTKKITLITGIILFIICLALLTHIGFQVVVSTHMFENIIKSALMVALLNSKLGTSFDLKNKLQNFFDWVIKTETATRNNKWLNWIQKDSAALLALFTAESLACVTTGAGAAISLGITLWASIVARKTSLNKINSEKTLKNLNEEEKS